MSGNRCFDTFNLSNYSSSDYIKSKRRKTIFEEGNVLATTGGYKTKHDGSKYIGPLFIKNYNDKGCLVATSNYELLYDVIYGKNLVKRRTTNDLSLSYNYSLWLGNFMETKLLNKSAVSAKIDGSYNYIVYPTPQDFDIEQTGMSNSYPGLIVDPSFNIFYPRTLCTKNNYIKNVTYNFNNSVTLQRNTNNYSIQHFPTPVNLNICQ
jgi:hypothetical protein